MVGCLHTPGGVMRWGFPPKTGPHCFRLLLPIVHTKQENKRAKDKKRKEKRRGGCSEEEGNWGDHTCDSGDQECK